MGKELGITSEKTRSHGLRQLAERGLIVKSYQGGMRPLGPTRWALTWRSIDYWDGLELERQRAAPDSWKDWSLEKSDGSQSSGRKTPRSGVVPSSKRHLQVENWSKANGTKRESTF